MRKRKVEGGSNDGQKERWLFECRAGRQSSTAQADRKVQDGSCAAGSARMQGNARASELIALMSFRPHAHTGAREPERS